VPDEAEEGDFIAVFLGFTVPFVLRRVHGTVGAHSNEYQLIGHCYVHGIMDGELIEAVEGSSEIKVKGAEVIDIILT
jgi:hypothetical protein